MDQREKDEMLFTVITAGALFAMSLMVN